ncbi:MAG: 1-acyl-sn-glycerol-3-phosphate acyltransferase [Planctomycetes bacterium]|nr:1-acyl-sn-glycerol-3-phosphate acyltransferase [Planctomycetota bacterium]
MPSWLWPLARLAAFLALWTAIYEIVRFRVLRRLGRNLRKSVHAYVERNRVDVSRWKFASKPFIREELLNDSSINEKILEVSRERGLPIHDVRDLVDDYIEEIVPAFNLLSYYKVAYPVARFLLRLFYSVVVDREALARQAALRPTNACAVYVMNHRSNADYVLVARALAESVSISYAVGEWARVWPLENLFKSFGSYFVRRNFRDPLYHRVLERYVQLLSRQGVTQGIFIEGGLSRDGKLRDPKIGLLDYILQVRHELGCERDIVFLPVGINFDRVLEDVNLLAEAKGARERRGLLARIGSLGVVLGKLAINSAVNVWRYVRGDVGRYGYASVSFGAPVSLNAWLKDHSLDLAALPTPERRAEVKRFADDLMGRIASVIPVTPVPLVCSAILAHGGDSIPREALLDGVRNLRRELTSRGAPIVMGHEFESLRGVRQRLDDEKAARTAELHDMEERMLESDEARRTLRIGLEILGRRGLLTDRDGQVRLPSRGREILGYYANSLLPFAPPPAASPAQAAASTGGAVAVAAPATIGTGGEATGT